VLWPDNGTWYRAEVEDLSVKNMTADLFYGDTEEQETANLAELIEEGQIAISTCCRRASVGPASCQGHTQYCFPAHSPACLTAVASRALLIPVHSCEEGQREYTELAQLGMIPGRRIWPCTATLVFDGRALRDGKWPVGPCTCAEEERSIDHVCNSDEIELDEKYLGRQSQEGAEKKGAAWR
jgi:hypothetical protein